MNKKLSKEICNRLFLQFWKYLLIYFVVVIVLVLGGYYVCRQKLWYSSDALYPLLHWLHTHIFSAVLAVLLIGGIVIACCQLYYIVRLMERMTDAVAAVYNGSEELIKLPEALKEIEVQLNFITTNVKNSRYEAKRAEQQKSDMIMYMAHDLKTPLTSVIGYLSILQEEELPAEMRKRYLSIVSEKAYRLEELINEFFEVTRFNFSHMPLELSKINLSRMIEQIVYEFKPIFAKKDLECRVEVKQDIYFRCDVNQMERVFDNLLRNVSNYSYQGTVVKVSVLPCEERNVRILIRNHGKTIPKEKLEHIFEQFYRLDSSRDSKTGGTGLGLAIAREIIELHHGRITCESENETICFEIIL